VVAELSQAVVVTADTPLIDVRRSAAIFSIAQQTIRLLPQGGRNFSDVLTTVAGAQNARHGLSIDCSTGPENTYIVKGVRTNDIVSGVAAQASRLDCVNEIQVKSRGRRAGIRAHLTKPKASQMRLKTCRAATKERSG
jgi:hypothetical protein